MKKVLLITFFFNKDEEIGSIRPRGLAKYLPMYGWEPIILTAIPPKNSGTDKFNKIETVYEPPITVKLKKLLGLNMNKTFKEQFNVPTYKNKNTPIDYAVKLIDEVLNYPDAYRGWYKYAINAGLKLVATEKIDAIISSSPPPISNIIAKDLKAKVHIPWVVDFRDLWSQAHYLTGGKIRQTLDKRMELKTLSGADALVTVSAPLANKLNELHDNKKVYVITNAFDPDIKNPGVPINKKFNISYTGRAHRGKRDPEPLFKAIYELSQERDINLADIEVNFYGDIGDWLIKDIEKYALQPVVKIHGKIPREKVIEKQRESQILLLLTWNDLKDTGIYTGKLFEYLAAQRPILSIGFNGDVVEELLNETGAGIHVSTVDELKNVILTFYHEYKKTGTVSYKGVASKIDKYNHREMAKKFAFVLDNVVKNNT